MRSSAPSTSGFWLPTTRRSRAAAGGSICARFSPGRESARSSDAGDCLAGAPKRNTFARTVSVQRGTEIGSGVAPRTKRLLKVRNRSTAGCCEALRTQSKILPDCRPASRFFGHAGCRERASNVCNRTPAQFPNPESNPRPHGGSDRGFGGRVIFGGGIGEPPDRQGAALFNQGIDSLNHDIPDKASFRGSLELARRRWQ